MVTRIAAQKLGHAVAGTLGMTGERMSRVDTAWLRMDSDVNLMMITGVWVLQPGIAREQLLGRVRERLLSFRRFRQRVVEDAAGATWVDDAQFDIDHHVRSERLPQQRTLGAQQALQAHVAELCTQPLPRERPLWQFHLVEDFTGPDGQPASALIVRIHHCIADGMALIAVTMSLTDGGTLPPARARRAKPDNAEDWIADALIRPFTGLTVKALGAAGQGAAQAFQALADPSKGVNASADVARMAYQVVSDLAALALMPDDSATRLKGRPGGAKKVAWCQPIALDEVKVVGRALGASINDVLLACVAGAIGDYLRRQGDNPQGLEIRAMVPVNLRPLEKAYQLGNRFGLAPLVLPVGLANPVERVYAVRRRMTAMKGSLQPLLAFSLLAVAGLLIKPAQDALLHLFSRKTTAVMTNVPGPKEKIRFCGASVEQMLFWVPQSGDVGLGVSILSYGGGVQFGLIADTRLCPEPQAIIDGFAPEFERLSLLTLMLPWGEGT